MRGKVRNVSCYDPSAGSGTLAFNLLLLISVLLLLSGTAIAPFIYTLF